MTPGQRLAASMAVVQVVTPTGKGTGVAVYAGDVVKILTCKHVVERFDAVTIGARIDSEDGWRFEESPATVERVSSRRDLALLAVDGLLPSALKLASSAPSLYDDVIMAGCLEEVRWMALNGIVQCVPGSTDGTFKRDMVISGFVAAGLSGSAVVDPDGALVGLVCGNVRDDKAFEGLAYAEPWGAIRAFLRGRVA